VALQKSFWLSSEWSRRLANANIISGIISMGQHALALGGCVYGLSCGKTDGGYSVRYGSLPTASLWFSVGLSSGLSGSLGHVVNLRKVFVNAMPTSINCSLQSRVRDRHPHPFRCWSPEWAFLQACSIWCLDSPDAFLIISLSSMWVWVSFRTCASHFLPVGASRHYNEWLYTANASPLSGAFGLFILIARGLLFLDSRGKAIRTDIQRMPARSRRALIKAGVLHSHIACLHAPGPRLFLSEVIPSSGFIPVSLGLNIVVGICGLLDLGYVAFFAIGAYTIGYPDITRTAFSAYPSGRLCPFNHHGKSYPVSYSGFPFLKMRGDFICHRHLGVS